MLTNSFGTILLKILPLITTPIISSLLTPDEYGRVALFLTWMTLVSVFVGLQAKGSIQNALLKYGKENINEYCSSTLSLAFLSFIAFFVPSIIFRTQLSSLLALDELAICLIVPTCFASFVVAFFSSYFLSLKRAKANLLLTFFTSLIVATSSILCAYLLIPNYNGYIIGYTLSYMAIGFSIFFIYVIRFRKFFSKDYWRFCLIFSLPLIFHMLSNTILAQSDKLMIQYIKQDESGLGIYSMMHTVATICTSLWSAMNAAFVPFFYDYLKEDNIEEIRRRSRNYAFVFICIIGGFSLVCQELASLLVNEQYLSGLNLVPLMVLDSFFIFLYSFGVNYEFFHSKTIWIAIGTVAAAILNIGLNYLFLQTFGIIGITIATTISYALLFIFHEIISRFVVKKYPIKATFLLACIAFMAIFTALTYLFWDYAIIRWILLACDIFIFFYRIIKTKTII